MGDSGELTWIPGGDPGWGGWYDTVDGNYFGISCLSYSGEPYGSGCGCKAMWLEVFGCDPTCHAETPCSWVSPWTLVFNSTTDSGCCTTGGDFTFTVSDVPI